MQKELSLMDLEAQAVLELPERELLHLITVNVVLVDALNNVLSSNIVTVNVGDIASNNDLATNICGNLGAQVVAFQEDSAGNLSAVTCRQNAQTLM